MDKILQTSALTFLIVAIYTLTNIVESKPDKIVCYFTNWAVKRPGYGSMSPEHIDPCLCTHLIYAFSEMKDNELFPMEKFDQTKGDKIGFFERMNNLKKQNPKLRTLLAVGGWDMGMGAFTAMVNEDKNIEKFVSSSIEYLRKWNFDGLDLDFEYPGIDWRGSPPSDKMAFTKLCKMLSEGFEKEAKKTGNERLLLTAAVAGARNTIDKAYEVDKVSEYIDWWNLMTYDLHGPWDTNAGHHSALTGKDKEDYLYIDFVVKYYESKGAPRSKLVLGLANYGRSDSPAMPYTGFKGESGFISYYESCLMLSCENWKEFWNEAQMVPFAKGKENFPWAGYDNVKSMKIKAEYIIKEKLGGAMFWTIDLDDFTGKFCCQGFFPLIRTVKSVLENEPKFMPPANICNSCPTQEYKSLKKKYRKRRSADDVCKEKGEGVWPDTSDCTKYFICRSMSTAWSEKKHEACYSGSYFDESGGQCKWVGQNNFDCEKILSKSSDDDNNKSTEKSTSKNEIFGQPDPDTVVPAEEYTCTAQPPPPIDTSNNLKCFSCEAEGRNANRCKRVPVDDSSVITCDSRKEKCFSKAVFNTKSKELVSFSRGCGTLSDLEPTGTESENKGNGPNCYMKPNSMTRVCYELCDKSMCNMQTDLRSEAVKKAAILRTNGIICKRLRLRKQMKNRNNEKFYQRRKNKSRTPLSASHGRKTTNARKFLFY